MDGKTVVDCVEEAMDRVRVCWDIKVGCDVSEIARVTIDFGKLSLVDVGIPVRVGSCGVTVEDICTSAGPKLT